MDVYFNIYCSMKFLTGYKIYENKSRIDDICRKYTIINYTIKPDGSIDVDGSVDINKCKLEKLPLKFGHVTSYFDCSKNYLQTLEGSPDSVGGDFYCSDNELTSLKGCTSKIDSFFCSINYLYSLEYFPTEIGGNFLCRRNPIHSIVRYFIYSNAVIMKRNGFTLCGLIEFFNDADIVQDHNIICDRLVWFFEEIGLKEVGSNGLLYTKEYDFNRILSNVSTKYNLIR